MAQDNQKQIFSKNLNKLLKHYGLTQKDFAKELGENPQTINSWCTGYAIPRINRIQKIADYFHIGKSDLLDDIQTGTLLSLEEYEILNDYYKLNHEGREQLKIQLKNLTLIPKYLKSDTEVEEEQTIDVHENQLTMYNTQMVLNFE